MTWEDKTGPWAVCLAASCSPLPYLPAQMQSYRLEAQVYSNDSASGNWELTFSVLIEDDGKNIVLSSTKPLPLRGVRSIDDAIMRAEKVINHFMRKMQYFSEFVQKRTDRDI